MTQNTPQSTYGFGDLVTIDTDDGIVTVKTGTVYGLDLPNFEFSYPTEFEDSGMYRLGAQIYNSGFGSVDLDFERVENGG